MTPLRQIADAVAAWMGAARPPRPGQVPPRAFVYCAIHHGIVPLSEATHDADTLLYICRACAGQEPR